MGRFKGIVCAAIGAFACLVGSAANAANRCVDSRGKVTYQDIACEPAAASQPVDTSDAFNTKPSRNPASSSGGGSDPAYSSARGAWRGPAQMHLTLNGARQDTGNVTAMVIEIKLDGAVGGFVDQEGCKLAGLASQFVAPYIARLDVTLSACKDRRFDGRYQGQLTAIASAKEAKLTLSTFVTVPGNRPQFMTIEAVLKR